MHSESETDSAMKTTLILGKGNLALLPFPELEHRDCIIFETLTSVESDKESSLEVSLQIESAPEGKRK